MPITKFKCKTCNKIFYKNLSSKDIEKGKGKYCSNNCRHEGHKINKKITCRQCGKSFETKHYKRAQYCSQNCSGLAQQTKTKENCLICGKTFWARPAQTKRGKGKYCSHKCNGIALRGEHRGKKYNKLTAINFVRRDGTSTFWKCKCECGSVREYDIHQVSNGRWKSCGCYMGQIKKCLYCGKEFKEKSKANTSKYCSKICLGKAFSKTDKYKETKNRWNIKNRTKILENKRKSNKKITNELWDSYIKDIIRQQFRHKNIDIDREIIDEKLVDIVRERIQARRLIKNYNRKEQKQCLGKQP